MECSRRTFLRGALVGGAGFSLLGFDLTPARDLQFFQWRTGSGMSRSRRAVQRKNNRHDPRTTQARLA